MDEQVRSRLEAKEAEVVTQMASLTAPEQELTRAARSWCLGESEPIIVDRQTAVSAHEQLQELLGQVRTALHRLDEGSYGACEVCGETIPGARLEARPWATTCLAHG